MKQNSLTFLVQGDEIWLGMKKRGFGEGRYNGFGGKFDPEFDTTILDTAQRETLDESGFSMQKFEKVGECEFQFEDGTETRQVHIFRCDQWTGEPKESEEMTVEKFTNKDIPLDKMWPADLEWIPYFLEGKKFKASFLYNHPFTKEGTKVLKKEIIFVENFL